MTPQLVQNRVVMSAPNRPLLRGNLSPWIIQRNTEMERTFNLEPAVFANLIDVAQERIGGQVLWATDEFFAPKESLIKPGRSAFTPQTFNEQGQVYDGWETRRKGGREGSDSCIVKLAVPTVIQGIDIDTNHFLGNHPPYAALDALNLSGQKEDIKKLSSSCEMWNEVLPRVPLKMGVQNLFSVHSHGPSTHVRLRIYPDGGVARLRVYGQPHIDWSAVGKNELIDLALINNGGHVVAANDMFFGDKNNLIFPGRGINMGDGWETRRRREPGNDWVIVKLGHEGTIKKIEIDTNHYKGNSPHIAWIDAAYAPSANIDYLTWPDYDWLPVLPESQLKPHNQHFFENFKNQGPFTHVRLHIDNGGVSRLRVLCQI